MTKYVYFLRGVTEGIIIPFISVAYPSLWLLDDLRKLCSLLETLTKKRCNWWELVAILALWSGDYGVARFHQNLSVANSRTVEDNFEFLCVLDRSWAEHLSALTGIILSLWFLLFEPRLNLTKSRNLATTLLIKCFRWEIHSQHGCSLSNSFFALCRIA